MNKEIFRDNFIKSVKELTQNNTDLEECKFILVLAKEENVKYNSKDDFMRLSLNNVENLKEKALTMDKLIRILSPLSPLYPLWIEISYKDRENKIIEVKTSLRFRKPSELKHKETDHPPFMVC